MFLYNYLKSSFEIKEVSCLSIKLKKSDIVFDVLNTIFMLCFVMVTLYPFVHVAFASVSNSFAISRHRGLILHPIGFNFEAYKLVFKNPMIMVGYSNTIFYVVVGTTFNILATSIGAYVLSIKGVKLKNFITFIIVFTMFFSGGLIPNYLQVKKLGLLNKRLALVIPNLISTYNLLIMRNSFMAIPESLDESARIDGANDYKILFNIIIPVSKPIIAVMILFYGVGHWNSWFSAMIYLRERKYYPLQLILREILIASDTNSMTTGAAISDKVPIGETVKYATIMVATLPILFSYPFLQKYFVKGIMIGALKG